MPPLWTTRADDPKHQRTFFLGVWAPPPRLTAPLGLVRAGLFLLAQSRRQTDHDDRWAECHGGQRRASYAPGNKSRTRTNAFPVSPAARTLCSRTRFRGSSRINASDRSNPSIQIIR